MLTKMVDVVLVDINPRMVWAWQHAFEKNREVKVVHDSMLNQRVDAWVTSTNSLASMDGGLDGAIKGRLGAGIERRVKQEVSRVYGRRLPVGHATCVETDRAIPKYLVSTPTMHSSAENVSDTLNTALACAAAFHMIDVMNATHPGSIRTVALPGFGACTGRVPVKTCAYLMWIAYNLFEFRSFPDFAAVRTALEQELWLHMERPGAA